MSPSSISGSPWEPRRRCYEKPAEWSRGGETKGHREKPILAGALPKRRAPKGHTGETRSHASCRAPYSSYRCAMTARKPLTAISRTRSATFGATTLTSIASWLHSASQAKTFVAKARSDSDDFTSTFAPAVADIFGVSGLHRRISDDHYHRRQRQ